MASINERSSEQTKEPQLISTTRNQMRTSGPFKSSKLNFSSQDPADGQVYLESGLSKISEDIFLQIFSELHGKKLHDQRFK